MKKSPLSTPGGQGGNFYHGRGRRRGYVYNQTRSSNDNYHRFSDSNLSPDNQHETNMVPLETSSPIRSQNNRGNSRGNWRQLNDRYDQRFSSTGISGSYNNQRSSFQSSPGSPYLPYNKNQRNYQQHNYKQKNEPFWYRKLPISQFLDLESMCEDPWAELEKELGISKTENIITTLENDSSVQIILEKNRPQDSSMESMSGESTINVSSSCENINDGSSVDLQLENMNFSQNSKNSILSDISSSSQKSK